MDILRTKLFLGDFRKDESLPEYFLSRFQGHWAAVFEPGCWVLSPIQSSQVRMVGPYLAHVQHPTLFCLVYEAMDDEACLAFQLEVGSLDGV